MTDQQKLFVDAYLLCNGNATEAARSAGYKNPNVLGSILKKKSEVATEISRRLDEYAMPANEVIARLTEHARADITDFYEFPSDLPPMSSEERAAAEALAQSYPPARREAVRLALDRARRTGKSRLIKSIEPTEHGVKITLHDAQAALVQLGKYHRLFVERVEHDLTKLSDDELDRRIAQAETRKIEAAGEPGS